NAVEAIAPHLEQVARAVDAVADRLRSGGRLHYFGAGTSGLVAAMDAAECPATFGVAADLVQAHTALEAGQEDDRILGQDAARAARIVADLAGVSVDEARRRLDEAGGDVRAALAGVRGR